MVPTHVTLSPVFSNAFCHRRAPSDFLPKKGTYEKRRQWKQIRVRTSRWVDRVRAISSSSRGPCSSTRGAPRCLAVSRTSKLRLVAGDSRGGGRCPRSKEDSGWITGSRSICASPTCEPRRSNPHFVRASLSPVPVTARGLIFLRHHPSHGRVGPCFPWLCFNGNVYSYTSLTPSPLYRVSRTSWRGLDADPQPRPPHINAGRCPCTKKEKKEKDGHDAEGIYSSYFGSFVAFSRW